MCKASIKDDGKVLEMDCSDGSTTLPMCTMPLNYTLKMVYMETTLPFKIQQMQFKNIPI